jgi:hypothetical protein
VDRRYRLGLGLVARPSNDRCSNVAREATLVVSGLLIESHTAGRRSPTEDIALRGAPIAKSRTTRSSDAGTSSALAVFMMNNDNEPLVTVARGIVR